MEALQYGEEIHSVATESKKSKTGVKKKVSKVSKQEKANKDDKTTVNLNVEIDRDLRDWAKLDAARNGYLLAEYVAALIRERQEIADPIEKPRLLFPRKS